METKDYLPLATAFVALIAIFSSYYLLSKQILKNKRSAWIEDFRKEIANYYTLAISIKRDSSDDDLIKITNSSVLIIMLLDIKRPKQKAFETFIASTTSYVINHDYKGFDDLAKTLKKVLDDARSIIDDEFKRL
ncbi:hypothetical protein HUW51_17155 [Adhaeribacter swui]|uniref:DUF4760 domain-containing protein n=1 Tax=Adhaeribacter swui TaxID=2086471 RepID=A0A7G7GB32_9BACT|nr:hypothetical protein [Adhaeribacter swui]QNF34366.1 hypothetical protein HUW51_17155 [Adhaeribacter swui]